MDNSLTAYPFPPEGVKDFDFDGYMENARNLLNQRNDLSIRAQESTETNSVVVVEE